MIATIQRSSCLLRARASCVVAVSLVQQLRSLGTTKAHLLGSDPLHLLQQECHSRGLCDEDGKRAPGVDWRIVIALGGGENQAPNLRTVNIEKLSSKGIDFVLKQGSAAVESMLSNNDKAAARMSFLHSQGKFLPGQSAEQWRGEGICTDDLDLEEVVKLVPIFTLTSLVGSKRLLKEKLELGGTTTTAIDDKAVSPDRMALGSSKSHFVQVMQQTRNELENGQVTVDELKQCIHAIRLQPTRVECMLATPEQSVMWDRWEWMRNSVTEEWNDPHQLVPH